MNGNKSSVMLDSRNRLIINGWTVVNLQSFRLCIDDDRMLKTEILDGETCCFSLIFSHFCSLRREKADCLYEECEKRLLGAEDDEIFEFFSKVEKDSASPIIGSFSAENLKKEIIESLSGKFTELGYSKDYRAKIMILSIIFGRKPEKWLFDYKELFNSNVVYAESADEYEICPDAEGEMHHMLISAPADGITFSFGGSSFIIKNASLTACFAGNKIKFIKKREVPQNPFSGDQPVPDDFAFDGAGGMHKINKGILTVSELGRKEKTVDGSDFVFVIGAQFAYLALRKDGSFVTNLDISQKEKISSAFSDGENIFIRFADGAFLCTDGSKMTDEVFTEKMLKICE